MVLTPGACSRLLGLFLRSGKTGDPADDRFRAGNDVYLKGVRVRFVVKHIAALRIRMVLYKPRVAYPFTAATYSVPSGLSFSPSTHVQQAFGVSWITDSQANISPAGPFSYVNINRSQVGTAPPGNPLWALEASDDSIYTADLCKGDHAPLGEKKLSLRFVGSAVAGQVSHTILVNILQSSFPEISH